MSITSHMTSLMRNSVESTINRVAVCRRNGLERGAFFLRMLSISIEDGQPVFIFVIALIYFLRAKCPCFWCIFLFCHQLSVI